MEVPMMPAPAPKGGTNGLTRAGRPDPAAPGTANRFGEVFGKDPQPKGAPPSRGTVEPDGSGNRGSPDAAPPRSESATRAARRTADPQQDLANPTPGGVDADSGGDLAPILAETPTDDGEEGTDAPGGRSAEALATSAALPPSPPAAPPGLQDGPAALRSARGSGLLPPEASDHAAAPAILAVGNVRTRAGQPAPGIAAATRDPSTGLPGLTAPNATAPRPETGAPPASGDAAATVPAEDALAPVPGPGLAISAGQPTGPARPAAPETVPPAQPTAVQPSLASADPAAALPAANHGGAVAAAAPTRSAGLPRFGLRTPMVAGDQAAPVRITHPGQPAEPRHLRAPGPGPEAAPESIPTASAPRLAAAAPDSPRPDLPAPAHAASGGSMLAGTAALHPPAEVPGLGTAVSALASATASGPQGLAATPPAEIARLAAPQIVAAIAASAGSGRVEIRLDPPELGTVEILFEMRDQTLRATVVTERHAVGEMMRRHADILLTQLQDSGFADVDLRFGRDNPGSRWGSQGQPGRPGGSGPALTGDFETASAPQARATARDGLDLRF